MSDEACRTMANQKKTTDKFIGEDDIIVPYSITEEQTTTALRKASKCVIGLKQNMKESLRALAFWFPWMKNFTLELPPMMNYNNHKDTETRHTLRPDLIDAILAENVCDMRLYEQMVQQFEKQIEYMDAHEKNTEL